MSKTRSIFCALFLQIKYQSVKQKSPLTTHTSSEARGGERIYTFFLLLLLLVLMLVLVLVLVFTLDFPQNVRRTVPWTVRRTRNEARIFINIFVYAEQIFADYPYFRDFFRFLVQGWYKGGSRNVAEFCLGLSCSYIMECPVDCTMECPVDFPWDKKKNPSSDLLQPKLGFFI